MKSEDERNLLIYLVYTQTYLSVKKLVTDVKISVGQIVVLGHIYMTEQRGKKAKRVHSRDSGLLSKRNVIEYTTNLIDNGLVEDYVFRQRNYIRLTEKGNEVAVGLITSLKKNIRKMERGERL